MDVTHKNVSHSHTHTHITRDRGKDTLSHTSKSSHTQTLTQTKAHTRTHSRTHPSTLTHTHDEGDVIVLGKSDQQSSLFVLMRPTNPYFLVHEETLLFKKKLCCSSLHKKKLQDFKEENSFVYIQQHKHSHAISTGGGLGTTL